MAKFKKANPKKQVGRPSLLTPDIMNQIISYMRIGAYVETAIVTAGISKQTFYDWAKKANKDKKAGRVTEYTEFLDAVDKAVEECVVRDLNNIDKAAMGVEWEYERYPKGSICPDTGRDRTGELVLTSRGNPIPKKIGLAPDWGASAWRLERRHGKQWKPSQGIEHSNPDGTPVENNITVNFVKPTDKKVK